MSSAFRKESVSFEGITFGRNIASKIIMIVPPINSAIANCHPSISHKTIPSSITRFVLANIKTIDVVKSAPLRKIERPSADAA